MLTVIISSAIVFGCVCILIVFEICLYYYDKRARQKLIAGLDIEYHSLD